VNKLLLGDLKKAKRIDSTGNGKKEIGSWG